jgi:hypothetical protein
MPIKKSTREYWIHHYQSFKAQEITQREYCRQNNLGYWTFNKWKREFDQEDGSTLLQQLPVKYQPQQGKQFEIILSDTVRISIPDSFSEDTLKKILSAMRTEQ